MAANDSDNLALAYDLLLEDYDNANADLDDNESLASLETDDGEDHPPEKILAESKSSTGWVWYLVKWKDCAVLRSSWEHEQLFADQPWILDEWLVEKQRQAEGKSEPLDIIAFTRAVLDLEKTEKQRRILRRLRRKFVRVLSIVA